MYKKYPLLFVITFAAVVAVLPQVGIGADFGFKPRVAAGVMNYSFTSSGSDSTFTGGGKGVDYDTELVYVGLGGTIFYDRYFTDIYYQQSAKGQAIINESQTSFGIGLEPERTDFAFSAGMNLWRNLIVFAGYFIGETNNDGVIFDGGSGATDTFPNGKRITQQFEEKGPFAGAGYAWHFSDLGTLSINLAVAFLSADTDEGVEITPNFFDKRKLSGDAVGLSYGVSWQSMVTEKLGYTIKINGYNYDFDDFEGTVFDGAVGNTGASRKRDLQVDESMIGVSLNISHSFF